MRKVDLDQLEKETCDATLNDYAVDEPQRREGVWKYKPGHIDDHYLGTRSDKQRIIDGCQGFPADNAPQS